MEKMHAAPKSDLHPVIQPEKLAEYDAFLLGIPTRFGNIPAQWKAFWDSTSGLWRTGALWGKYAGVFISTGTLGGGQEATGIAMMSTLAHHGISFVPLGYKNTLQFLGSLDEVHGGSAWGAGTLVSGAALTFDIVIYVADVLEIGWTRITSTQPAGDPAR
jgi:NAD(P)H dehydrogenase (quinone)